MDNPLVSSELALAAARSRIYALLSLFLKYPEKSSVETLVDATVREESIDAVAEIADQYCTSLTDKLRLAFDRFALNNSAGLEECYLRVFGASPRGRIAAYECEYGSSEIFQFSSELSDITGFYAAFGLRPGGAQERPDHIATECEFMRVLCAKEADLLVEVKLEDDRLEITRQAQKEFVRQHLGRWATAFSRQLAVADPNGGFGAVAELLEEFISIECRNFGVSAGPAYLPLRDILQPDDPGNCISCGKAEGIPGALPESESGADAS
jgi:DMSO reductase family type II enzyme chaperone